MTDLLDKIPQELIENLNGQVRDAVLRKLRDVCTALDDVETIGEKLIGVLPADFFPEDEWSELPRIRAKIEEIRMLFMVGSPPSK